VKHFATSRGFWFILSAAALFYLALFPYFPVGYFNDDALYILGARSLLQGHFIALQSPHPHPLTWILPGYPLFLAPFVAYAGVHLSWLKGTSLLLTLGSSVLLWRLLESWPEKPRLVVLGAFALNPFNAVYATTLLSEPCLVFLILASLVVCREVFRREEPRFAIFCGLLCAMTSLVRAEGIFILPAIVLGLAAFNRRKQAALVTLTALLILTPVLGFYLKAPHSSGSFNNFVGQFKGMNSAQIDKQLLLHSAVIARNIIDESMVGWDLPGSGPWGALGTVILIIGLGFILRGAIRMNRYRFPEGLAWAMGGFVLMFALLHAFWFSYDARYILAVLPFLCIAGVSGTSGRAKPLQWAGILIIAAGYASHGAILVHQAWSPVAQAERGLPQNTFDWIRAQAAPDAVLLTPGGSRTFLFTDRHTVPLACTSDPEEFRYCAGRWGVTHIFFEDRPLTREMDAWQWSRCRSWISASPRLFPPLYANRHENTEIFGMHPDPRFQKAFELYLIAELDLSRADRRGGLAKLKEALALEPGLQLAQTAFKKAIRE
jgi:hypothetical protein